MQVKEITSKKLFKEYLIEIPSKEIEEKIDLRIKELAPKTDLPGFRPGKAPLNLIKKKYEKDILGEIINKTVQENSKKLLSEKKLKPLRLPKIEITKFDKSTSLEFNIKIDLPPEFDLFDFSKIKLNDYKILLTKKEKDEGYENFIKSQSEYQSIKTNREIKNDDNIKISIYSDNKDISDTLKNKQEINLIIGSNYQFLPDLDKLLLKKKVKKNDKIILDINIPKQKNPNEKIKCKFNIEILDIKELHKINVNKDYLEKNKLKSIDDLKKKVEENISNQYALMSNEISKKELLDRLEKNHTFDLPDGILSEEKKSIWHRVEHAKKDGTLDPDDINLKEEELKKRYEKIAERRVKLALIVSNIATKNKISINEEEITKGLIEYTKNYPGQEKQIFEFFKKNPSEIEVIRGPLFEKKVLDYVMTKVKKINKEINVKDFMKLQMETFKQN